MPKHAYRKWSAAVAAPAAILLLACSLETTSNQGRSGSASSDDESPTQRTTTTPELPNSTAGSTTGAAGLSTESHVLASPHLVGSNFTPAATPAVSSSLGACVHGPKGWLLKAANAITSCHPAFAAISGLLEAGNYAYDYYKAYQDGATGLVNQSSLDVAKATLVNLFGKPVSCAAALGEAALMTYDVARCVDVWNKRNVCDAVRWLHPTCENYEKVCAGKFTGWGNCHAHCPSSDYDCGPGTKEADEGEGSSGSGGPGGSGGKDPNDPNWSDPPPPADPPPSEPPPSTKKGSGYVGEGSVGCHCGGGFGNQPHCDADQDDATTCNK